MMTSPWPRSARIAFMLTFDFDAESALSTSSHWLARERDTKR